MIVSRRSFLQSSATAPVIATLPEGVFGFEPATQRAVIRTHIEIGRIRPELHDYFAEHQGSCVYGGLWVGKNSPIPNIDGYRRRGDRIPQRARRTSPTLAGRLLLR